MEYTHHLLGILFNKVKEIGVDNIDPNKFIQCFHLIADVREPNVIADEKDNLISEVGWLESLKFLGK